MNNNQNQRFSVKNDLPDNNEPVKIEHKENSDTNTNTEGTLTVDVYKERDNIVVEATLAGVDPDSMEINVTREAVSIKGERKRDREIEEDAFYYQELFWGSFSRTIILPEEVDPEGAEAKFVRKGILVIKMPLIKKGGAKKLNVKIE